jgi:RNA polymerase sigma-B factor
MQTKAGSSVARRRADLRQPHWDAATREHLAAKHLPLVRRLCERYRYSGVPIEDLVQVGSIGLIKAIDKFDPDRGTNLLAFAVPVIMGEIKNYFRDHGWAVKVPRKLQRQKRIVERAVESLSQIRGRSPTVGEIAEATGLSEDEVYDTFEVRKFGRLLSLEAEYERDGNTEGSTVLDYLGTPDPQLDGLADKIDLTNILTSLTERERTIIQLKFYSGLSQSEIAVRLGISQMHVSRLQRYALEKLKLSLSEGGK